MKRIEELINEKLQLVFEDEKIELDRSRIAGGMTNHNYIMSIHGTEYVVRQPGFMTSELIDRRTECINNNIASNLGINSNCVYFDDVSGIKISTFIKDSQNIAQSNPYSENNIMAVSDLLKVIHHSTQPFSNVFDWQSELAKYEQIIKQLGGDMFSDYCDLKQQLLDFMDFSIVDKVLVPCHNDTVPENFITSSSGRTYLIDWEYSGMNDPAFDIAAYIIESSLPAESIDCLLSHYYGATITDDEIIKIKCYMMAQDLLWTAWALIRHYGGDDFLDYCRIRYERFRKNILNIIADSNYSISEMVN